MLLTLACIEHILKLNMVKNALIIIIINLKIVSEQATIHIRFHVSIFLTFGDKKNKLKKYIRKIYKSD